MFPTIMIQLTWASVRIVEGYERCMNHLIGMGYLGMTNLQYIYILYIYMHMYVHDCPAKKNVGLFRNPTDLGITKSPSLD